MTGTAPVLGYDFRLDGPAGWHEANRYLIWTGHFAPGTAPMAIQERIASGIETLPLRSRSLSMIPAGTPHRLAHLFGFWRISGADMLVLRAELPEATYICLYVSSGPEHAADRLLWYCAACGAELAPWEFDVRRFGARAFWERSLERVRSFNADHTARTCACGAVHRTAFGFEQSADTDDERAACAGW